MLQNLIDDTQIWRGSEEATNDRFLEPIRWKNFSHICTAPVKYDPSWSTREDVSFIVTGVQLHVKKHNSKTVLHLRLLFSKVLNSFIAQKSWGQGASECSQKSGFFSAISSSVTAMAEKEKEVIVDSSVYPDGPPVLVQTPKLLKFVDMSQICKGPQDSPGHWLVTGAMLQLENGKIRLHVKFSLLNIVSSDRYS